MKKFLEKDINTFNFEMVYDEYKDFMNQTQVRGAGFGVRLYKRPVALKVINNCIFTRDEEKNKLKLPIKYNRHLKIYKDLNWFAQWKILQNVRKNIGWQNLCLNEIK